MKRNSMEFSCFGRLEQKIRQCKREDSVHKSFKSQHSLMTIANAKRLGYNSMALISLLALCSLSTVSSATISIQSPHQSQLTDFVERQQQQPVAAASQVLQERAGGLDPNDYIDEAGELEVMANQQQIPTVQLMSAAGHIVPDNFFLPGGSIPALHYARAYQQQVQQAQHQQASPQTQQQQQQQLQQLHQLQQLNNLQAQPSQQQVTIEQLQQLAMHVIQPRHIATAAKFNRPADLLAAASAVADQQEASPLIDFNGYNLVDGRDASGAQSTAAAQELADFLNPANQASYFEQQQQQYFAEQQLAAELAALTGQNANQQPRNHPNHQNHHNHPHPHHHHQQQQQQQQHQSTRQSNEQQLDNSAQSSNENAVQSADQYAAASVGPAYQISGQSQEYAGDERGQMQQSGKQYFGLPNKSSNKEPSGMLKPLGNPKTISSPVIDFVTNQLPKTSTLEKLAEKLPQAQTPTVFSFSSSKDPAEKGKVVLQKKRNVLRQAEHLARMMIKTVNDKFGTNIGDQTDIPFLLSSIGPLSIAQNLLTDPTLFVSLLNTAEKAYQSDVLPGPAKSAIRPVLNIFRVPNKKRDKANLLNIISFLASGGQTPSSTQVKHRQGYGVEKSSKGKNRK